MKYSLNKLDLKTTNGFKINDIKIDIDIPIINDFKEYDIVNNSLNDNNILITKVNKKLTSRIGLEFDKYYNISITIPKGLKLNEPIEFKYLFENNDLLIDNFNILFEEDSKADIIINHVSKDDNKHFHHLKINIKSNKYSDGSVTYINNLNDNSYNFVAIENDALPHSNIKTNIIDIGCMTKLYNVFTNTYESAKNKLNSIYIGKDNNIIDINYTLNNVGKSSINEMKVEGVLDDNAKKNFRGTIDFKKGCSESIGEENENCVLLSDSCMSRSLPSLLCHEENVVGAHGVSSGKIENDKLFYIMSRGFDKKEAEKLIVKTNLNTIIHEIPNETLQDYLEKIIDKKLG